jgi:hypothetical protein
MFKPESSLIAESCSRSSFTSASKSLARDSLSFLKLSKLLNNSGLDSKFLVFDVGSLNSVLAPTEFL